MIFFNNFDNKCMKCFYYIVLSEDPGLDIKKGFVQEQDK